MSLLTEEQIEKKLSSLHVEWTVVDTVFLQRVFTFPDFESALTFVNEVGKKAEALNHHPGVQLSWGKVVITLTTHSEQGLTDKDFHLAKEIESIA